MRPTKMTIDLKKIESNANFLKAKADGRELMCIVKADAYGHGMVEVSKKLYDSGYRFFGVAILEEALELRKHIDCNILVLGAVEEEDFEIAANNNIDLNIHNINSLKKYRELLSKGISNRVHIKVDTGMHRIGFSLEEIEKYKEEIRSIKPIGIFTHMPKADEEDKSFTYSQIDKFKKAIDILNINFKYIHYANTATILSVDLSFSNLVRAGIGLYGISPIGDTYEGLNQAASITSKIVAIRDIKKGEGVSYAHTFIANRDTKVATLPIGYADGYKRSMSRKIKAYSNSFYINQIGNITMDQIMFDITDTSLKLGNEVELLGEHITANYMASIIDTIGYEIVTTAGQRLRREYI